MMSKKQSSLSEETLLEALREVIDPELGVNVVDLGLVESITISDAEVQVSLGMTSPACPVTPLICRNAQEAISRIPLVKQVEVRPAENFHWSADLMSPLARQQLGSSITPLPPTVRPPLEKKVPAISNETKAALTRLPLLAIGMVSLVVGMWTGVIRLGWDWPLLEWNWIPLHGPLMVCGFLGTVIGMERAVGLGKKWAYIAPGAAVLGAGVLLSAKPGPWAAILMIIAGVFLCLIFMAILKNHRDLANTVMGLGALCWLIGNLHWLTVRIYFLLVPWWIAFIVLTIAGERLELNRFLEPSRRTITAFITCMCLILAGCAVSIAYLDAGTRLLGLGLVALALWLGFFDVARRTVKQHGLTRYAAVCLLSGYVWLAFSGVVGMIYGEQGAGPFYDTFLHSLFIGFAFSMIFGHAPIIFPSILNRPMSFSRSFYVHLIILHLGLMIRIVGNLSNIWDLRLIGGLISVIAIVLFLLNTIRSIVFSK